MIVFFSFGMDIILSCAQSWILYTLRIDSDSNLMRDFLRISSPNLKSENSFGTTKMFQIFLDTRFLEPRGIEGVLHVDIQQAGGLGDHVKWTQ